MGYNEIIIDSKTTKTINKIIYIPFYPQINLWVTKCKIIMIQSMGFGNETKYYFIGLVVNSLNLLILSSIGGWVLKRLLARASKGLMGLTM